MPANSTGTGPRSRPLFAVVFGVLAGAIVALVALAFLWPVTTSQAHDVPVGVVGGHLPSAAHLPIDPRAYDSRADVVKAIHAHQVYGAFILDADEPEVLVAGADGPATVSVVEGVGSRLAAAQGLQFATADVAPLAADDPTGAGMSAIGFPLVLGGVLGGALVSLLVAGVTRRLFALAVYAAVGGVLLSLVTGPLLGILHGHFAVEALVIGVGMLGTASTVVGLNALLGTAGIAVGAVITMLIGNPISGATLPHQFIAGPWGLVGQYFVPGATATLVRESNYFPDASTLEQWVVLLVWILGGIMLSLIGHYRSTTPVHLPEVELEQPHGAHAAW